MKFKPTIRDKPKFFHYEIKWILVLAQFFGLLPVRGITRSVDKLKFTWWSKRVLLSLFIISATTFLTFMCFYRMCFDGFKLHSFGTFVFNMNSLVCALAFLRLAKRWPELMKYWCKTETILEGYNNTFNIGRKFAVIVSFVITAAFVEHLLSILVTFLKLTEDSYHKKTEMYFRYHYPHVFEFLPYYHALGIFSMVMNVCNVFSWNFLDAFLMVISICLTHRFHQINEKIATASKMRIESKYFWLKLREDYFKISTLCKVANDDLALIIIISFTTNMYFIMSQLYWSLIHTVSTLESAYFYFSFGLLLSRTVAVTLFSSRINDESRKPIGYLIALDSSVYNSEVERFITHVHCEPTALTGSNFFTITRGLLFSMAGTIVTYELFLIQSNINFSY